MTAGCISILIDLSLNLIFCTTHEKKATRLYLECEINISDDPFQFYYNEKQINK